MKLWILVFACLAAILGTFASDAAVKAEQPASPATSDLFDRAVWNAGRANEAFERSLRMTRAWLKHADETTGLIPRYLTQRQWLIKDSAADNFPFLVLTAWLADRPLYDSTMLAMLESEQRHTNRLDRLADDFDFAGQKFVHDTINLDRVIFGNAEYVKDGLLILTEAMGRGNVWMKRAIGIIDDIWKHAPIQTPYGNIPSTNIEVNGDLLQVMARLYFATGDDKYLNWAVRLGDYYLLGDHHPTRDLTMLRLRDHGCEIVSGLCELYVAVHFARPYKKQQYQPHIHEMLDRILEVGVNEHGMMFNWINPQTGEHDAALADTWGYNYNGFYSIYLVDGTERYRDAVKRALSNLDEHYRQQVWEPRKGLPLGSADGYADAIESALCLLAHEEDDSAFAWVDSEIDVMWAMQRADGIVEGWHGDGNFARTSIMYALCKTQGTTIHPWRADVRWGAVRKDGKLYLVIEAGDQPWTGKLHFASGRHKTHMNLPLNYPRINHLPQWFSIEAQQRYQLQWIDDEQTVIRSGGQLQLGIDMTVEANQVRHLIVEQMP